MAKKRKNKANYKNYSRAKKSSYSKPIIERKRIPKQVEKIKGKNNSKKLSLRQQFINSKKKYYKRLIYEQSIAESMGAGSIESQINTPFRKLDYESVYKEGIHRKINGKLVNIKGAEAVRIQIESLNNRANPYSQKNLFIENYVKGGIKAGYSPDTMREIRDILSKLSPDELTIIIREGNLKSIQYNYAGVLSDEELLDSVMTVANTLNPQKVKNIQEKAKTFKNYVKKRIR